jgi:hypothetical protein
MEMGRRYSPRVHQWVQPSDYQTGTTKANHRLTWGDKRQGSGEECPLHRVSNCITDAKMLILLLGTITVYAMIALRGTY